MHTAHVLYKASTSAKPQLQNYVTVASMKASVCFLKPAVCMCFPSEIITVRIYRALNMLQRIHRLTFLRLNGAATSLFVLVSSHQRFLESFNSLGMNKGQLSFCSNCYSSPALQAFRWFRIWCFLFQISNLLFSEFSHWPSKANWIYNTSYK